MDHRASLIFAASLLCGSAHAFYAQATPPTGFVAGAINTFNGARAGVTASVALGRIAANASLNVGGKAVSIATRIPLAATAARVAALAIYSHPAVRIGVGVAAWLGLTGYLYNATKGVWEQPSSDYPKSDGYLYNGMPTLSEACNAYLKLMIDIVPFSNGKIVSCTETSVTVGGNYPSGEYATRTGVVSKTTSSCPAGWFHSPAGCVQSAPMVTVPQEQFVEDLSRHPMPPNILPELPFDLPVEVPYIEPIFVPTGNPVKNPNYDPSKPQTGENQPYVQPGVKVDPANDAKNPFQVNLQPVNRPVDNPQGSKDPVPEADPGGSGNNDKPRDPEKDERDFCDKHPDVIACQKMDEPEDPGELKTKAVDLDFQVQSGYAGSAVCPAPMTYEAFGHVLSLSWQPFCDSLAMVKNLLLAFAWISAAFILLGAKKE